MGLIKFDILIQTIIFIVILSISERITAQSTTSVLDTNHAIALDDASNVPDNSEFAEQLNNTDDSHSRQAVTTSQNVGVINTTSFDTDDSNNKDSEIVNTAELIISPSRNLKGKSEHGGLENDAKRLIDAHVWKNVDDIGNWTVTVRKHGQTTTILCKDVNETTVDSTVPYELKIPDDYNVSFPKCCPSGHRYKLFDENGDSRHECASMEGNNMEMMFEVNIPCGSLLLSNSRFIPTVLSYGDPCENGKFKMSHQDGDDFYLGIDGKLYVYINEQKIWRSFGTDEYCLETFEELDENNQYTEIVLPLMCFEPAPSRVKLIVYATALLISVPFLIGTFIVYMLIPQLRDVHGKALCCHVACLAVAFVSLASIQLSDGNLDMQLCAGIAFLIQFSFLACFFWLNVMCFETYLSIRDAHQQISKIRERCRFIKYSIYAWGGPILIQLITLFMQYSPLVPSSYAKPGLGDSACWFETTSESLYYFYLPVGLLILINIVLFIKTAKRLSVITSFDHPCRPKSRYYKTLFRQCIILFLVMGINWVMEIISWAAGGPIEIWIIFDLINAFQGLIIFGIFICHKDYRNLVWKELKKRFACCGSQRTGQELSTVGENGPMIVENGNRCPVGENNTNIKLPPEEVNLNENGADLNGKSIK